MLTTRQKRFYDLLRSFIELHGDSPTLAEMKVWMEENGWGEIRSLNSIKQYLDALGEKGLLRCESRKRGIVLSNGEVETVKVPLVDSRVACGYPATILSDTTSDFLEVSKKLISNLAKAFAFRCSGDSMNEAGIEDGDFVIVEPQPVEIRDGDLVLANVSGCGTVKRFKRSDETISLFPESSNIEHKPIYLHSSDEGMIVGKIASILKN
ncbi:transcriptional repressor LexA [Patescibacteria group bacterium]|nr:transcriptional repressor LexA [Patescibacteria group bacterium]